VFLATDLLGDTVNRKTVRVELEARKDKSSLTQDEKQQLENKLVREANRVALKVMTNLDQFNRELSARGLSDEGPLENVDPGCVKGATGSSSLDRAHVVNVIRWHKVCLRAARMHTHMRSEKYITDMRVNRLRQFPASKRKSFV
jgi:hypothetical protein